MTCLLQLGPSAQEVLLLCPANPGFVCKQLVRYPELPSTSPPGHTGQRGQGLGGSSQKPSIVNPQTVFIFPIPSHSPPCFPFIWQIDFPCQGNHRALGLHGFLLAKRSMGQKKGLRFRIFGCALAFAQLGNKSP